MNVMNVTNHMKYGDIFEKNTANGKILWAKIASEIDLPESFIEQYFLKLKKFGIEKNQSLTDEIINNHSNELNWYALLKYQFISENTLENNILKINNAGLWQLLLKTQKLSYDFLLRHLENFKNDKRSRNSIEKNAEIDESIKNKICSFLTFS